MNKYKYLILSKEQKLMSEVKTSCQLNSHIIYLNVAVVWGCDEELGVRGEGEGSDGHGVTWEREEKEWLL